MKYFFNLAITLSLLFFLAAPDWAQVSSQPALRLSDLITEARQKNPEIQAARAKVQAARAAVPLATSLPDPMGMVEVDNQGTKGSTLGEAMMSQDKFTLSQTIPFPGKLMARGRAAGKEADRSLAELQGVEWDVLTRLKKAYYDLAFNYESLDILDQNRSLLEQFVKTAEVKYETGSGTQADALRAQVELDRLDARKIELEQQKTALEARIRSLLARPSIEPLGRPETTPVLFDRTYGAVESLALANNPGLLAQEKGVEAGRAQVTAAKYGYVPDLTLAAGYGYRGQLDPMVMAGVGINIPLWALGKQRNEVKQAQSDLNQARYSREAARQMVLADVREGYSAVTRAQSLVALYETRIVPRSDAALKSAFSNYKVGSLDFLTLISDFTTLLDYRLEAKAQEADLAKAVANLEQVAGAELAQ